MAGVRRWSGRETRTLREAKRMSLREFAQSLGVSDRMISKWEAGGETVHPRPRNQAALDALLANSSSEERARFENATPGFTVSSGEASDRQALSEHHEIRHRVDRKIMTLVHSGIFLAGPSNEPLWLPDFYIDVYPVSNSDYARFVHATGHRPPPHWLDGCIPADLADHPVVFVTWHDARAYATWAGKLLPENHQWEKAARGPQGHVYPWGDQHSPARCNVRESGHGTTTPVHRYRGGMSPYGVYDLCGNVWEWLSTQAGPDRHELKGGSFTTPFDHVDPSTRKDGSSNLADYDIGFRCVAAVPPNRNS
ncbi:SUMF1/EgtB/PvdO family nonheme iron enzyme [Nocardia terpenica]|uniref:SUMF1/EgtB/PvdO family nonheme iron enzyme n=1 Tax=Nocardia terpenica TaxID=455432 RepID=UPI002FE0BAA2